ncbi:MAG TPA: hypothetical protein VK993_14415 [Chthoniobacterales bacterium]|nr:hypothetical protein [Chthoniobacterales bacterium]
MTPKFYETNDLNYCSMLISTSVRAQHVDDLVAGLLRDNPQLEAARSNWEAMNERPRIAQLVW